MDMVRADKNTKFLSIWFLLAGFAVLAALVLILCLVSDQRLPELVGRELTEEEKETVAERNSPLTDYVYLSPNADFPRGSEIKKITVHHMAGALGLEELGKAFGERDRRASANYAIDGAGRVALYVEEANRAWTSSSRENDDQAVTIEVANDEIGGDWHVGSAAYGTLIDLCVDICERNGIEELVYTGDAEGNLTIHKMFKGETECPGPYLESKMEEIAAEVNERLRK
jgi:N-acetylmuramoyl-L-alanine amidase